MTTVKGHWRRTPSNEVIWIAEHERGVEDPTYKIVRFHCDDEHEDHRKVIRTGLTLEEAQEHCNDESTHGGDYDDGTAWFDGYTEET